MLRILIAVSLISLTFSCAHKDSGKGLVKLSGDQNQSSLHFTDTNFDSTFFVGYVDYFPETREFYAALFYREGHEYPDEELLESRLDSVIIFEEDWGRERLPLEEGKRMLMLAGLDTLSVFNRAHEPVCRCPLTRVEYFWNGLESSFIAVFKADEDFAGQTEELYGIGAGFPRKHFARFAADEVADVKFNEFLIKQLNISRARQWDMRHYRIAPPEATYSIISTYSMESNESQSYLTFAENNEVTILNEELDNYHYLNILPVPILINGKPLLLISAGYPSSDVIWDYLAAFDGNRYEAIDYNRVHLKSISSRWPSVLSDSGAR